MEMPDTLCGVKLLISDSPLFFNTKQFRFPKSKRKRIRKKWAQRPENTRTLWTGELVHFKDQQGRPTILGPSCGIEAIKRTVRAMQDQMEARLFNAAPPSPSGPSASLDPFIPDILNLIKRGSFYEP